MLDITITLECFLEASFGPPTGMNGAYPMNTDDLSSQFDMLALNNGTHLSLPQLSVTNQNNNTTNLLNKTNSATYRS